MREVVSNRLRPTGVPVCRLLHGDNLCLLQCLPEQSVNLVYLDPPFNSGRTYTDRAGTFSDHYPSMAAYIEWMRPRIVELFRVLKPGGSLYLHCDDHANAYLALLLAQVFGPTQLINRIVWKRASAHSCVGKNWGRVHDTLLFYAKRGRRVWNTPSDAAGNLLGDYWGDVPPLGATSKERVGYPTQKPLALLRRIIEASSNPGHVVLDPFCGAGTTLVAAQQLGRQWIGMDASAQAIAVSQQRLDGAKEGRECRCWKASATFG